MADANERRSRVEKVASMLRPLRRGRSRENRPLSLGQLLGVHWTTVYRLRRRFWADPVASSVAPYQRGLTPGCGRVGDTGGAGITADVPRAPSRTAPSDSEGTIR